jgi:hypothetical protein
LPVPTRACPAHDTRRSLPWGRSTLILPLRGCASAAPDRASSSPPGGVPRGTAESRAAVLSGLFLPVFRVAALKRAYGVNLLTKMLDGPPPSVEPKPDRNWFPSLARPM